MIQVDNKGKDFAGCSYLKMNPFSMQLIYLPITAPTINLTKLQTEKISSTYKFACTSKDNPEIPLDTGCIWGACTVHKVVRKYTKQKEITHRLFLLNSKEHILQSFLFV